MSLIFNLDYVNQLATSKVRLKAHLSDLISWKIKTWHLNINTEQTYL